MQHAASWVAQTATLLPAGGAVAGACSVVQPSAPTVSWEGWMGLSRLPAFMGRLSSVGVVSARPAQGAIHDVARRTSCFAHASLQVWG